MCRVFEKWYDFCFISIKTFDSFKNYFSMITSMPNVPLDA